MRCSLMLAALALTLEAFGGVVLHMPPPPAAPVISNARTVTPLQRFAAGEPAMDRARNLILLPVSSSSQAGGGYGWDGYGWGGYGWGGYGYGWGAWGCSPAIFIECCQPRRPVRPSGMVFGSGLMQTW